MGGELSQEDIAEMLAKRASRREMEHYCLLPSLPAQKARGYLSGPPPDSNCHWSKQYRNVIHRLAKFQFWIATQMEHGLPPIEPGLTSWACKSAEGVDHEVARREFAEGLLRLKRSVTEPHDIQSQKKRKR